MGAELLLGVSLIGALIAFAPQFLLLDERIARATVTFALAMVFPLASLSYVLTRARLSRSRLVLRSLALGSATTDPDDIARLSSVPAYVTAMFVTIVSAAVALFMLAPFRPGLLDFETALSLVLLGLIILATAALPLYIAVRAAVARVLELVNPDSMQNLLEQAEANANAERR